MTSLEKLNKIREGSGRATTLGLSDDIIRTFAENDRGLVLAIDEALEQFRALCEEYPEKIAMSEVDQISHIQSRYVNFYHDDTINPNVDSKVKGCSDGIQKSHPVNREYPPVGKKKLFNKASFIKKNGINLSAGKITCLSCHNLKNDLAKHLAVDNIRSKLCLTCHRK